MSTRMATTPATIRAASSRRPAIRRPRHRRRLSRTLPPSAAHVRAYVRLRSIDPARNRDRGYTLTWTPALFEGGALLRAWGRTCGPERTRIDYYYYPDRAGAQAHVEAILRRRLRHGYRVVEWQ
jgi:predicted DNA-binding WGR domain protein